MAEEKSLEEILSDAKELRRTADELIKASENLMEKYERLRRQTGEYQKEFAARARESSDAAKGSSDRRNRDLSQGRRVADEAAESVRQGTKRRLAKEKVARPESLSE
jgi:hypothetical protein